MGLATFELVCVLCQTLVQPAQPALPWAAALWAAEERALHVESPVQQRLAALPAPREPSLGTRRSFANGRELRVNLTPTPAQCAPLVTLSF